MLLKEDQRNFNCWNYRRHIATLENIAPHTEFTFSGNKIKENFSNYSAFHHRSFYFRSILNSLNYNDQFNEEFSIVENAIFTEPDDQSAWWYHQFLIRTLSKDALSNTTNVTINSMTTSTINDRLNYFKLVLESQINVMNSLLELESNSKWARVCLVELYSQLIALPAATMITSSQSTDELVTKRSDLLTQLVGLDATHAERYKYLLRKSNSPSSSSSS
jgi:geranylgeranyl transferase type-2 subunit alpha